MSERILGSNRFANGSPFHTEGPITKNARAWLVEVRAKGTNSKPRTIVFAVPFLALSCKFILCTFLCFYFILVSCYCCWTHRNGLRMLWCVWQTSTWRMLMSVTEIKLRPFTSASTSTRRLPSCPQSLYRI